MFQVFMEIRKAYESLERGRCLDVLRVYGMEPNLAQLIATYWDWQRIVPKTGKFLGKEFRTGRGLMQETLHHP